MVPPSSEDRTLPLISYIAPSEQFREVLAQYPNTRDRGTMATDENQFGLPRRVNPRAPPTNKVIRSCGTPACKPAANERIQVAGARDAGEVAVEHQPGHADRCLDLGFQDVRLRREE